MDAPVALAGLPPGAVHLTLSGAFEVAVNVAAIPTAATHGPVIEFTWTGSALHAPAMHLPLISHSFPVSQAVPSATLACWQLPSTQESVVQAFLSSQPPTHSFLGGGGGGGAPPQPDLVIPKPGSEMMTEPSSLTRAGPVDTNCSMSWSNWKTSMTCPGGSASAFGSCTRTGGSKCTPAGCSVHTIRG